MISFSFGKNWLSYVSRMTEADIERAKLLMAQSLRIEIRHLRARAALLDRPARR